MKSRRRNASLAEDPGYDAAFFADKHGLTLQAARVILAANGPSRIACDAAAKAFLIAIATRQKAR
jgi:hypothetical protein